jgi:hypothetical protein
MQARPSVMSRGVILAAVLLALSACAEPTSKTADAETAASVSSSLPSLSLPPRSTMPQVEVPKLVGTNVEQAKQALAGRKLRWTISYEHTRQVSPGTVMAQGWDPGTSVVPGTAIVLRVARAPAPPPPAATAPPPTAPRTTTPRTTPPSKNCDPAYPGVCLHEGIGDYDCAGGSGNGPNYVDGPIRVLPPDPFDLDRDGDGWGCES